MRCRSARPPPPHPMTARLPLLLAPAVALLGRNFVGLKVCPCCLRGYVRSSAPTFVPHESFRGSASLCVAVNPALLDYVPRF